MSNRSFEFCHGLKSLVNTTSYACERQLSIFHLVGFTNESISFIEYFHKVFIL